MSNKLPFPPSDSERIAQLQAEIRRHDDLYHNQAQPEIADDHYDALVDELKALEAKHPELAHPDSPTRKPGAARPKRDKKTAFPPHRHAVPMLSIANTYSADEIRKFAGRVQGALSEARDPEPPRFGVELKIDGVAFTAFYRNGTFQNGATRGDGNSGDDITANLQAVEALPKSLKEPCPQGEIEVRGEIYLANAVFAQLVEAQEEEEAERIFANPRNATAGTLKLLDPEMVRERRLACFFYQVVDPGDHGLETQSAALAALEKWGLPVNPTRGLFATPEEILAFRDRMDTERHRLPYGTDGLVIKLDSFRQQEILGLGTKSPNWAVAYKFAPERAETTVENIRVQVGKLGRLTPVADLKPVLLAGSTITHASLHNESLLAEKDVRIGDHVLVEKAGEIIPQVYEVIPAKRSPDSKPFAMPPDCPSCGKPSSTSESADGKRKIVLRFCLNPDCPARRFAALVHFASRDAMDIEGMGPAVVQWLLDQHLVKDVADIYTLKKEQLLPMTKSGRELLDKGNGKEKEAAKSVDNLLAAIEESKTRGLAKLLFALAIPNIGNTAAQLLARRFGSLDALGKTDAASLAAAEMGESTAYRTLGNTSANKLAAALKNLPAEVKPYGKDPAALELFLESLKLANFGKKRLQAVAAYFGGVDRLLAATPDEVAMVKMGASQVERTLGPVAAHSLRAYLESPEAETLLNRLAALGVATDANAGRGGAVADKVFVITGTLPHLGRVEAKRIIEAAGGLVAGSISHKTDYLVAGEAAGSKLAKAEEYGVKVIDEAEMLRLCGQARLSQ